MGQAAAPPPTPEAERPVLKARFEDVPPPAAADSAAADSAAEAAPAAATDAPAIAIAPDEDGDGEKENQASPSPPSSSPPPAIVAAPAAVAVAAPVAAKSRPPFQRPLDLRANGSREPARPYVRAPPPPPPRRGASSSSDLPHSTNTNTNATTTNDDCYDDDDVGDIPMVGGTRLDDDDLPPPPPSPTAAGGPARPAPGASGARLGDVDEATGIPLGPIPASPDQVQLARTRADGRARPTGGGGGGGGGVGVLRVGRGLFGKGRRGSGDGGNSLDESGAEYVAAPLPSSRNLPPRPPSPADEADREAVPEEAGATPAWAPAVDATDDGVVNDSLRAEVEEEARMRATILDVNGRRGRRPWRWRRGGTLRRRRGRDLSDLGGRPRR